jgi:hypothetical protein
MGQVHKQRGGLGRRGSRGPADVAIRSVAEPLPDTRPLV